MEELDTRWGTRRFEYRGHRVEIATRYAVTIDRDTWDGQWWRCMTAPSPRGRPRPRVPSYVDHAGATQRQ